MFYSLNRRRVTVAKDVSRGQSSMTRRLTKHHMSRRIPNKIRSNSKSYKILDRSFSEPNLHRNSASEDEDHRLCSTPIIDIPVEEPEHIVYLSKIHSEVFASAPSLSGLSSPSSSSSPVN
ncbi:hypothetical protein V5N11_025953 [Cardamine amara subsp. amara]|uniref:Uncharacterized protein n=1 Tax=Cardamine amara subsp. amara TaxID=228776 RepID=A0ABD0Z9J6_CARAN